MEFRYLGRMLTATYDDWPAVAGNIRKARESWGRLARVLGREGADPKVSRSFNTAVTQQVLLFGAETWVLTRKMESSLDAFQGRVARRLTGRQPCQWRDGRWFYPSLAGAMKEAGCREDQDVDPSKAEYGRAIYCDTTDSGPM